MSEVLALFLSSVFYLYLVKQFLFVPFGTKSLFYKVPLFPHHLTKIGLQEEKV